MVRHSNRAENYYSSCDVHYLTDQFLPLEDQPSLAQASRENALNKSKVQFTSDPLCLLQILPACALAELLDR